jgi:hypothetical protein
MTQEQMDKLENNGYRLIDSEYFTGTQYAVNDKEMLISAGKCGALRITKENITDFAMEVMEVYNCFLRGVTI